MSSKYVIKFKENFTKKVGVYAASLGAVFVLVSGGYGAGQWLSEIGCELDKMSIVEDYQQKLFELRESCNNSKVDDLERKTKALENAVEQLKTTTK